MDINHIDEKTYALERTDRYNRETAIFQALLEAGGNPIHRSEEPLPDVDIHGRWLEASALQTVTFDDLNKMSEEERDCLAYNTARIQTMQRIADGIYHHCVDCFYHIPMSQLETTPFRNRCDKCLKEM